jgi:hypothetical protein
VTELVIVVAVVAVEVTVVVAGADEQAANKVDKTRTKTKIIAPACTVLENLRFFKFPSLIPIYLF